MKMRWLGILWAVLGLTALVLVVSQKTALQIQTHNRDQAFTDLEHEALAASRLATVQTDALAKDLGRVVAQTSATRDKTLFGDFSAVSLLHLNGQGQWEPEWLEVSEELGGRATELQLKASFKDLPFANVGPLTAVYARLQDPTLSTYFVFLIPVKKPGNNEQLIALGLVPGAVFSKWSEIFKGSDRDVVVMDDHGFAVALSEGAYIGTLLDKHPFVAEVLKSRPMSLRSETKNLRSETVLGAAEKLDRTNLFVLVTRPFPTVARMIVDIILQNAVYWLGIALLTSWLLWITLKPVSSSVAVVESVELSTPAPASAAPKIVNVETKKVLDRGEAYQVVGPGLVQAMKGPVSVILGHVQLAQAKSNDPKLQENLVAIEKESRRLRETLENLGRVSGVSVTQEPQKVDVPEVISRAIAQVRPLLNEKNISFTQELSTPGITMAVGSQLKDVFVELLKNAAEAMDGCPQKELRVSSSVQKDRLIVVIEDSGVGIAADDFKNLFQPFYTTKDSSEHAGLSLSMARGVLRGFGGDIRFQAAEKNGTRVTVEIPVQAAPVAAVPPPLHVPVAATPLAVPPVSAAPAIAASPATAMPAAVEGLVASAPSVGPAASVQTELMLGGRAPLSAIDSIKMPSPPAPDILAQLNEEDEEWQQLPRQFHTEATVETDVIQIRKPKVRVKI